MVKSILPAGIVALACASLSMGPALSPANWPKAEREQVELAESTTISPMEARSVEGSGGIISAMVSPVSVYAGIQALKHGGNAADAAAATALTQVTMQLGFVVSHAGIRSRVSRATPGSGPPLMGTALTTPNHHFPSAPVPFPRLDPAISPLSGGVDQLL